MEQWESKRLRLRLRLRNSRPQPKPQPDHVSSSIPIPHYSGMAEACSIYRLLVNFASKNKALFYFRQVFLIPR